MFSVQPIERGSYVGVDIRNPHGSKSQLDRKWNKAVGSWSEVNCYPSTCMVELKKAVESRSNEKDVHAEIPHGHLLNAGQNTDNRA